MNGHPPLGITNYWLEFPHDREDHFASGIEIN
jgi:hypothetical protein